MAKVNGDIQNVLEADKVFEKGFSHMGTNSFDAGLPANQVFSQWISVYRRTRSSRWSMSRPVFSSRRRYIAVTSLSIEKVVADRMEKADGDIKNVLAADQVFEHGF